MNPQPGQVLTHYTLVGKIGEGGMGVVWKARDTRLDRHVAIKFLPADLTAEPERRQRFLREARTAAALAHPNIVTVHEIDEADGVTFIAMELVEGRTLRSLIGGRSMPIAETLRLATGIAEGLARAHQDHIVHRDLKPENVIVGADGRPRILDFGLARLLERQEDALRSQLSAAETRTEAMTHEGQILGTPAYMSPEQARGETVDERSDIFSFGVLLYEMATGRHPFKGRNPIETLAAILRQPTPSVSRVSAGVPPRMEDILGKCLEKDPEGRYQTSRDLVVDLQRLRRDLESGSSSHSGAIPPVHRWKWLALSAGVAAIVVVGMLLMMRPGSQDRIVPARPAHERREIAVLPFQNLSDAGPNAYFAGGLHDELLTDLAKVAALKVISRTSVMGYQGTSKPLKQIASELGVGSVVDGSVQVVGNRLRVNVQLIDAATDEHLWAESYDRTLDDAFAIQSDVAQRIVTAVGAALNQAPTTTAAPTANPEAWRLYLQGNDYYRRPGDRRHDRESAERLYEQALALDPGFALAHAALSLVHGSMHWLKYDPSAARIARQREEAETALRLAPDLPQAHVAMGRWYYQGRRDYRPALDEFLVALKGLPNDADLWFWIGATHRRLGHWDEVFATLARATQLDPRNADVFYNLAGPTYDFLHRYPEAVSAYERVLSLAPDVREAAIREGWSYVRWQGRLDTLRGVLDRMPANAELGFTSLAAHRAEQLLYERDVDGLLREVGDRFESENAFRPAALYAGWAHQLRGEHAAARAAFEAAVELLDSAIKEGPDDHRFHASRGLALAGLGRRDEALAEARWLQQSTIFREDAFGGPSVAETRAQILGQAGEADAAIDEIERLLAGPSLLTVHTLRLDPRWDAIRDHPRFKALLAKAAG